MKTEINVIKMIRIMRDRMDALELNNRQLAKRSGIGEARLSDIRQGNCVRGITFELVYWLARALGVSMETLTGLPKLKDKD